MVIFSTALVCSLAKVELVLLNDWLAVAEQKFEILGVNALTTMICIVVHNL